MKLKLFFLFIILICIGFFAYHKFYKHSHKVIVIQPFDDFSQELSKTVLKQLQTINSNTILRKSIPLPKSCYYPKRNRYRADKLIRYLKQFGSTDTVIIGLTSKDISTTNGNIEDWGIMGLGYCPGNACVVSTFRLAKNKLKEQFFKVAIHELGHTQGLPHCSVKTCFMRDAEGGNPLNEETDFCVDCKNYLTNWNLK